MTKINKEDLKKYYKFLDHKKITEVRTFYPYPHSDFVKNFEEFYEICEKTNGLSNVYVGINERKEKGKKVKDVKTLRVFAFDIDPIRKKDTASSDKQKEEARKVTHEVVDYLRKEGYPHISVFDSGNGYHVYLKLEPIEITDKNREVVKDSWKAFGDKIKDKFSTDKVHLDSVFDLSRIMKVPGTMSVKGKKKNWRLSKIEKLDDEINKSLKEDILLSKPKREGRDVSQIINENIGLNEILKKDYRTKRLYYGDTLGYKSRSEAELALACKLVWWELPESEIRNALNSSSIGKWSDKKTSQQYRDLTIKKAYSKITSTKNSQKGVYGKEEEREINLLSATDLLNMDIKETDWIIENFIPVNSIGILAAPRSSYKTWMALWFAVHIAQGKELFESYEVKKKNVLYIDEENGLNNLVKRTKMMLTNKIENLYFLTLQNINFHKKEDYNALEKIIKEREIDLVIIDTFNKVFSIRDENKAEEYVRIFRNIVKPLRTKYNLTWLYLHHPRKGLQGNNAISDYMDEVRGSSEFVNTADFVLNIRRIKQSELINFRVSKMRCGSEILPLKLRIVIDDENNEMSIEYEGEVEEEMREIDRVMSSIMVWINENQIPNFETKEIKKALKKDFSPKTIQRGLKELVNTQQLQKPSRGFYEVPYPTSKNTKALIGDFVPKNENKKTIKEGFVPKNKSPKPLDTPFVPKLGTEGTEGTNELVPKNKDREQHKKLKGQGTNGLSQVNSSSRDKGTNIYLSLDFVPKVSKSRKIINYLSVNKQGLLFEDILECPGLSKKEAQKYFEYHKKQGDIYNKGERWYLNGDPVDTS